jgi:hypothetical protein
VFRDENKSRARSACLRRKTSALTSRDPQHGRHEAARFFCEKKRARRRMKSNHRTEIRQRKSRHRRRGNLLANRLEGGKFQRQTKPLRGGAQLGPAAQSRGADRKTGGGALRDRLFGKETLVHKRRIGGALREWRKKNKTTEKT